MPKTECLKCQQPCFNRPGWFMPGEAEKAAKHLDLTLKQFFNKYLAIDWWKIGIKTNHDIFILAPAIINSESGREYPSDPRGRCIFFENGLCCIHKVRPFECAKYIHGDKHAFERHWNVAKAWDNSENQNQIAELLEKTPKATDLTDNIMKTFLIRSECSFWKWQSP